MAARSTDRWRGGAFVEVAPGEGIVAAARALGIDFAPAPPSAAEAAKRQRLAAELEAELARPLVAGTARPDPAAAPATEIPSRPRGDRPAARRRARSRGFLFGAGTVR